MTGPDGFVLKDRSNTPQKNLKALMSLKISRMKLVKTQSLNTAFSGRDGGPAGQGV